MVGENKQSGIYLVNSNLFLGGYQDYGKLEEMFGNTGIVSIVEPYAVKRPANYREAQQVFEEQEEVCRTLRQDYGTEVFRLVGFSSEMIPEPVLFSKHFSEQELEGVLGQAINLGRKGRRYGVVGVGGLDPGRIIFNYMDEKDRVATDNEKKVFLHQVKYALINKIPVVVNLPVNNERLKTYLEKPLAITLEVLDEEIKREKTGQWSGTGEINEQAKILIRGIDKPNDLNQVLDREGFYAQVTTDPRRLSAEAAVSIISETVNLIPNRAERIMVGMGMDYPSLESAYRDFLRLGELLRKEVGEEKAEWVLRKTANEFFDLEKRLNRSN